MPLSNYPRVLKYAVGDRPYRLNYNQWAGLARFDGEAMFNGRTQGFAQRTIITGWRTTVEYAENGTSALQKSYYTCKDILGYDPDTALRGSNIGDDYAVIYSSTEYELPEEKLFVSKNALAYSLDSQHINGAGNDGSKFFRTWGAKGEDGAPFTATLGFYDWVDWAGMNFRQALMAAFDGDIATGYGQVWSGNPGDPGGNLGGELPGAKAIITDNCDFTGATLPSFMDTVAEFRTNTFSYDAQTTIMPDGLPIGRALSGVVGGSSAGSTLTGSGGSAFTTQLSVGDTINIQTMGLFVIAAIASNTSLTVVGTFGSTFSLKEYSLQ